VSDVIAGWALGSGFGYFSARFRVPLLMRVLPGGMTVGLYTHL
jgi:hypothetical protein